MTQKVKKFRVDELLVEKGLCDSRSLAKALIMGGKVFSGDHRLEKPGKMILADTPIRLAEAPKYVSRGGEKLEGFIREFDLDFSGKRALDIGASTGGFTDCLLQSGVVSVTCVDVGRAQLHYKLQRDKRVTNIEKLNARYLEKRQLPFDEYPLIVMDVSFISIMKILGPAWEFLEPGGMFISLIKPQFEATKEEADEGKGIISKPDIHQRVRSEVRAFIESQLPNANILGETESSIKGTDGNKEFLVGITKGL